MAKATLAQTDPLFDTHAHFFTDDVATYPIDTTGAREGEAALRQRIASAPETPETVLATWSQSGVIGGAGVQYNTVYKTDNRYVMDVSDRYPDRISSVVILRAPDPETPERLERMIVERGVVGLRLYGKQTPDGETPWLDSPEALRTWEVADRHGINMVLMYSPQSTSATALPRIASLSERYPSTKISLDHFGWPSHDPRIQGLTDDHVILRDFGNIHFKLSTINLDYFQTAKIDSAEFLRTAVDLFGADRIMWGSDLGNTLEPYAEMAARARKAAALLTAEERRKVLCETGRRLFSRPRAEG